jgi:DNA-binding transcriptional ArsR family regulator
MGIDEAVLILSALGQATRLQAFRLLIQAGPSGLIASDVAAKLMVPRNTMSAHFSILVRAGLVSAERSSRQIIYRASLPQLARLTSSLVDGCCGGRPELCEPDVSKIRDLR